MRTMLAWVLECINKLATAIECIISYLFNINVLFYSILITIAITYPLPATIPNQREVLDKYIDVVTNLCAIFFAILVIVIARKKDVRTKLLFKTNEIQKLAIGLFLNLIITLILYTRIVVFNSDLNSALFVVTVFLFFYLLLTVLFIVRDSMVILRQAIDDSQNTMSKLGKNQLRVKYKVLVIKFDKTFVNNCD